MIIKPTIKRCPISELKKAIIKAEVIYTPIKHYQTLGANTRLSDLHQLNKQEAMEKVEIEKAVWGFSVSSDDGLFFICYLSPTCIVFD